MSPVATSFFRRAALAVTVLLMLTSPLLAGFEMINFHSPTLGENRDMLVYTPPGYDADDAEGYMTVFWLHGAGVSISDFNNSSLEGAFDFLMGSFGPLDPMILIFPDGSTPDYWMGSFYTNSDLYGAFEDYMINDVVTHADTSYNTVGRPDKRAIAGHSMGGHGAMKLAFLYPDMFAAVAAHSGPHDPDSLLTLMPEVVAQNDPDDNGPPYSYDPSAGTETRLSFTMAGAWSPNLDATPPIDFILDDQGVVVQAVYDLWEPEFPARLFGTHADAIGDLPLYFDCGTEDELAVYPTNVALKDTLVAYGRTVIETENLSERYVFLSYPGDHASELDDRIPIGLEFCQDWMLSTSSVGESADGALPSRVVLAPAWPNPFNNATSLRFDLAVPAQVELTVYDLLGRRVASLASGARTAGSHRVSWQPAAGLASGVYLLRLDAGDASAMQRVHFIK